MLITLMNVRIRGQLRYHSKKCDNVTSSFLIGRPLPVGFCSGTMPFLSLGATMRRRDFSKVIAGSAVRPIAVYAQARAVVGFMSASFPAPDMRSWNEA